MRGVLEEGVQGKFDVGLRHYCVYICDLFAGQYSGVLC